MFRKRLALPFQKMFAILLAPAYATSDIASKMFSAAFETGVFLLIPASNIRLTGMMSKPRAGLTVLEILDSTGIKVVRKRKIGIHSCKGKGSR